MAGLLVFGRKNPPDNRRDPQHPEKIAGDLRTPNLFRAAGSGNGEIQRSPAGQLLKRVIQIAPIEHFSGGSHAMLDVTIGIRFPQSHDLLRIWKRQRPEQDPVHYAENHYIRADADGQGQNRNQRETRIPTQHARAVTQILPNCSHTWLPRNDGDELFYFFVTLCPPCRRLGGEKEQQMKSKPEPEQFLRMSRSTYGHSSRRLTINDPAVGQLDDAIPVGGPFVVVGHLDDGGAVIVQL